MEREYIGVDLHKAFFQACAVTATGERLWEMKCPRDPTGLRQLTARCAAGTPVAVEASGPTWAFVDGLQAAGLTACVVDPRKTKLKAGYAAKTDKLDARRLADALRRDSVVSIYIPPPAIRSLRELCRGRHQCVRLRTRIVQMLRALLLRHDVADGAARTLYSARGRAWLGTVSLPGDAGLTLERLRHLLAVVHQEVQTAQTRVVERAATDPIATRLDALVGIGPVLALTLRAEIGDVRRFPRGAELASYAGLVPRVDASAARYYSGRITRQGSPWLRWALVEAAVHGRRRDDATGRWARKLAVRKGAAKARVALARVLCDDIVKAWRSQL